MSLSLFATVLIVVQAQFLLQAAADSCLTATTAGALLGSFSHDLGLWQSEGEISEVQLFTADDSQLLGFQVVYGPNSITGPVHGASQGSGTSVTLPENYTVIGVFGDFDNYTTSLGFTVLLPDGKVYQFSTKGGSELSNRTFDMTPPAGGRLVGLGSHDEFVGGTKRVRALTAYWSTCDTDAARVLPPALPLTVTDPSTIRFFTGGFVGQPFTEAQSFKDHGRITKTVFYLTQNGQLSGFQFYYGGVAGQVHGNVTQNVAATTIPSTFQVVGVYGAIGNLQLTALALVFKLDDGELATFGTVDGVDSSESSMFQFLAPAGKALSSITGLEATENGTSRVTAIDFQWQTLPPIVSPPPPVISLTPPSTATPIPTATPTPPSNLKTSSHEKSKAWIAGPVVGSTVGVLLVIATVFLLSRRRTRATAKGDFTGPATHNPSFRGEPTPQATGPSEPSTGRDAWKSGSSGKRAVLGGTFVAFSHTELPDHPDLPENINNNWTALSTASVVPTVEVAEAALADAEREEERRNPAGVRSGARTSLQQ